MFLFWRGGGWLPSLSIAGASGHWGQPRVLVTAGPGQRPYAKYAADTKRIYAVFTDCHIDSCPRNSLYLARYEDGMWRRIDGSPIASNAQLPFQAQQATKVYDGPAEGGRAWAQDVAVAADGSPVILYMVAVPDDIIASYWYATYSHGTWQRRRIPAITTSASSPGGATLDHEDPSVVYMSWAAASQRQIDVLRTPDGGASWLRRPVTTRSKWPSVRPVSPRGDPDYDVLWEYGERLSYRRFHTVIRYRRLAGTPAFQGSFTPLRYMPAVAPRIAAHMWTRLGRPAASRRAAPT